MGIIVTARVGMTLDLGVAHFLGVPSGSRWILHTLEEHLFEQVRVLGIAAEEDVCEVAEHGGQTDGDVEDHVLDHLGAEFAVQAVGYPAGLRDDRHGKDTIHGVTSAVIGVST